MQPTINYKTLTRRLRPLMLVVLAISIMLIAGFYLYDSLTFRITKTDPKTSYFATTSSYMDIYFNKSLSPDGLQIDSSPHFYTAYKVDGKKIRLTLTTSDLQTGRQYRVVLRHVVSKSGKQINNKIIVVAPKQIDFNDTSKAQQQASINQQDQYPYLVTTIPFAGFDSLTSDGGLTSEQEQTVLQAIYDYSNKINTKFTSVTLDAGSVAAQPYNPDTDNSRTTTFTFIANAVHYGGVVNYDDLGTATVILKDSAGTSVYQTPDSSQDGSDI